MTHHNFTDISPLSKYTELSEITLTDNPIKTIDPIVKLSKIQSIRLLETEEKEIFELLSNNKSAVASFCSTQYDLCFTAYWIQDWGFKTSYIKHYTYINVTVEPLMLDNFMELNNPVSLNKYLTLMKSKAKQIALSLLNEDEQFKGKVNYKTQSLHLVNSYFNFENK